jgi:integrase/recombinase XerD
MKEYQSVKPVVQKKPEMQEGVLKSRVARQPNKSTILKTTHYQHLAQGFKKWLQTLGYAESTVYKLPKQLHEFLQSLEQQEIIEVKKITATHAMSFIHYFKNRPNKRRSGGVSIAHVNKQIGTLNKFFTYLKAIGQIPEKIHLPQIKEQELKQRILLSQKEIRQLYRATDNSPIGMRDRAMLGVYYGCGLRKKEGLELEVSDVLFERRLLYVRKTKNKHERYVPVSEQVLQDLEDYMYGSRPLLLGANKNIESLFISQRGTPLKGSTLIYRLNSLKEKTNNPELKNRSFGLHALRHSIATHLLQSGMDLEHIALFLGHKSLESTQLYTHLVNEP